MNRFLTVAAALAGSTSLSFGQTPQIAEINNAYGLSHSELVRIELEGSVGEGMVATLDLNGKTERLLMTPKSVRSEGFQVLEQQEDGSLLSVDPGPVPTYSGLIGGMPGTSVVGGMQDSGLFAKVVMPDERVMWLQPINREFPTSEAGMYVMYDEEHIIEDATARCGVAPSTTPISVSGGNPVASAGGSLQVAELACDTDFEYFMDYGTVMNTSNRIQTVIGTMNEQYESEVNLTHLITTIIVRSNPADPYTSNDAFTLLGQFQNEWMTAQAGIPRDIAHLFTGRSINGGTIGVAFLGAICSFGIGYGFVESDFNNVFACATDLSAHELGHNWGGNHCGCVNATMNPFITCTNTFNTFSINEITNFAAGIPCLSPADIGTNFCTATPNSTGFPGFMQASGSTSISANSLTLEALNVPNQAAIFIQGSQQAQIPLGNGNLCIGGSIVRLTTPTNTIGNQASFDLPLAGIASGQTLQFQFWFRDPAAGGAAFNFTDGIEITFSN